MQHQNITAVKCDLSNTQETLKVMKQVGNVDLLVNNAGIAYLASFVDHELAAYEQCGWIRCGTAKGLSPGRSTSRIPPLDGRGCGLG